MRKYIFISGGVVSGLGKGITAASLGRLLKSRGLKVISQKMDPYINVDCGTMSPYQHGEVFVTEDGTETDLDLGHYERFIDENVNKFSNLTSGKVYWNVLKKERKGEYLGETVQVIPHITNEIKSYIYAVGEEAKADVVICEIGGTTGDIESQPFLEAIRQVSLEVGKENSLFIHVTLVPYIKSSGEYKSKPTQHSIKELMSYGIRPDIIVCRCEGKLEKDIIRKISMFCNVDENCVIENCTLPSLYMVPLMLEKQNFSKIVCEKLHLNSLIPDLSEWNELCNRILNRNKTISIALVGKYVKLHDAYLSVMEALQHGGYENGVNVNIKWISSDDLTMENINDVFKDVNGIVLPGGFGNRGIEGMILTCQYARENNIPFLGICLGMQIAAIEFARNVLQHENASSIEFDENTPYPIIHLMDNQKLIQEKGGSMRLGAYPCICKENSLLHKIYGENRIMERHRHRYELNNAYRKEFENNGMQIVGISPNGNLVESICYPFNEFYLGVQFHPEFKSRPNKAHPIFKEFIKISME